MTLILWVGVARLATMLVVDRGPRLHSHNPVDHVESTRWCERRLGRSFTLMTCVRIGRVAAKHRGAPFQTPGRRRAHSRCESTRIAAPPLGWATFFQCARARSRMVGATHERTERPGATSRPKAHMSAQPPSFWAATFCAWRPSSSEVSVRTTAWLRFSTTPDAPSVAMSCGWQGWAEVGRGGG